MKKVCLCRTQGVKGWKVEQVVCDKEEGKEVQKPSDRINRARAGERCLGCEAARQTGEYGRLGPAGREEGISDWKARQD